MDTLEIRSPAAVREIGPLRRSAYMVGLGAVGLLDLLALEDLTTGVQPSFLPELLILGASVPALYLLAKRLLGGR